MNEENKLREQICTLAASMYDRGLTGGSSGNISVRTPDGGLLVTPTGSCFGRLDPATLSKFDKSGVQISGDKPTKELNLHAAFYETRSSASAVVHLHSCHSVARSLMKNINPDNFLPPLTPYSIMLLGKVKLLPYFRPGDPQIGNALRGLAGKHSAVMLAAHGPVVAAKNLEAGVYAIEELEETAKLSMLLQGCEFNLMTDYQIQDVVTHFDIEWK